MKEKKNIERLFQEKFKNFESQPPADAWENIRQSLHPEKKKRRIIPFWIRLSGIAAALVLGFFVFNTDFSGENSNQDITDIQQSGQDKNNDNFNGNSNFNENSNSNSNSNSNGNFNENSNGNKNTSLANKQSIYNQTIDNTTTTEYAVSESENSLLQNKQEYSEIITKNDRIQSDKIAEIYPDSQKENLFIKDEDNPLVSEEINQLQQLLEEQNPEQQSQELIATTGRWRITPNVAPVTMNSISQGSPISDEFISNSKDYESSLGYGLGVNYAITPKLNIRTGINKLTLGYNTNDVIAYTAVKTADIVTSQNNIKLDQNSQNIVLMSESNINALSQYFSPEKGQLNQRIGYVEVPVELSYKLLDKRFGIDIIGGMSTLFLNENEVSVISNGMNFPLGEANNLNDVHFSTNLGLGFRYEIFKSLEANVEPMFKYQLGTFSRDDGNFKPYILGLYTGLSFKF